MASESPLGSIVAFEGRSDAVLTQLRLLPTSPQLLILPSFESYIESHDPDRAFDARCFIRAVHHALHTRNEIARKFLDGSTVDHKRLVFMNGGTPGAQALCIREIMKHDTEGDRNEAKAIFDELVKDGLAGLQKHMSDYEKENRIAFGYTHSVAGDGDSLEEDPITKAMRAADALDRQTANLHPPSEHGLNMITRPRSSSLPLYGYFDEFQDSTPFYVFGVRPNDEDSGVDEPAESQSAPPTPSFPITSKFRRASFDLPSGIPLPPSPSFYTASCAGEAYEPSVTEEQCEDRISSPMSEAFSIRSSDNVVYGEASVLDVRLSVTRHSLPRVKSLDRVYPATPKFRDLGIPAESWMYESETTRAALQHPQSAIFPSDDKDWRLRRLSAFDKPRFVVVKSRSLSVQIEPVPLEKKRKRSREGKGLSNANYVDRGTDALDAPILSGVFQPVLSPLEDLVVFLKDESSDDLLEASIDAFRNHRYPLLSFSPTASDTENLDRSLPGTPVQPSSPERGKHMSVEIKDPGAMSPAVDLHADDYDPFAYTQPVWQPSQPSELVSTVSIVRPPTPAQTPPPTTRRCSEYKVNEFHIASHQTAVSVQNSLRSVLAGYFPPVTQGYHQFQFPLLPEFDELWKPIFRGVEPGNTQRDECLGTQILAIGSQNGVKKEYSLAVTGRLEKVGRKSCEIAKTDRVDFRYLLANAMQAFTAQRLTNQTDNPFTNSYLLATLIIPHLETYLALHTDVRYLLLMYPPEHLATVLALQKLIGMEVMKVAQIVDSKSSEDSPFKHIRGASINSKSESKPSRPTFTPRTSSEVAVSEANYLLTSTASEKDIATFVSTVWKMKIEEPLSPSSEYEAERGRKKRPPPLSLKKGHVSEGHPATSSPSVQPTYAQAQTSAVTAPAAQQTSSPASMHTTPGVEPMKTPKSIKNKRSQTKLRTQSAPIIGTEAWAPVDDDSDDDVEERRLMPVSMQKRVLRKPNSRKALKFLGLA